MKIIQVAKAIGYSPEDLLNQIKAAGLSHKNVEDEISNEDKKILLNFIKSSKKSSKKGTCFLFFLSFFCVFRGPGAVKQKKTSRNTETNSKINFIVVASTKITKNNKITRNTKM